MTKEDYAFSIEWDYTGYLTNQKYNISDWVRTLCAKCMVISNLIHQASYKNNKKTIEINRSLEGLLALTGAYNRSESKFYNNYFSVIINDTLEPNIIIIKDNDLLSNLSFIPVESFNNDDSMRTIEFRPKQLFTNDETEAYKRNLRGYIEIKNYV